MSFFDDRQIDDLRRGNFTPAAYRAMLRVIGSHVARRGIPAPSGSDRWSPDDIEDLTQDLFTREDGAQRMVDLAVSASSADHFENSMKKRVDWFLADRARKTPRGKLRRHMVENLAKSSGVVRRPDDTWVAVEHADGPRLGGSDEQLHVAARIVTVDPAPYGDEAEQDGPATTGASMQSLCLAVLRKAGGPVDTATLLRVCARRLAVPDSRPARAEHDDERDEVAAEGPSPDERALAYAVRAEAETLWAGLPDVDRRLLAHRNDSLDRLVAAGGLGLRRSAVADRRKKLAERLAAALAGQEDGEDVIAALCDMADAWAAGGTPDNGPESSVGRALKDTAPGAPGRAG
jgi:hypothetical protein